MEENEESPDFLLEMPGVIASVDKTRKARDCMMQMKTWVKYFFAQYVRFLGSTCFWPFYFQWTKLTFEIISDGNDLLLIKINLNVLSFSEIFTIQSRTIQFLSNFPSASRPIFGSFVLNKVTVSL